MDAPAEQRVSSYFDIDLTRWSRSAVRQACVFEWSRSPARAAAISTPNIELPRHPIADEIKSACPTRPIDVKRAARSLPRAGSAISAMSNDHLSLDPQIARTINPDFEAMFFQDNARKIDRDCGRE